MSPALSTYIEVVRLFAALVVFVHHASYPRFGGGWIAPLGGYGHEAVVIFFVLSGFVIGYSHAVKDRSFKLYAASRLSRLWSVSVPALALTFVLDAWGAHLDPASYEDICTATPLEIGAALAFVNELWFAEGCVGSNIPFWSLSYEFIYYALFAVFAFAPRPLLSVAVGSLLVGPKLLLLAPCWVMGYLAWRHREGLRHTRHAAVLWLLSTAGMALLVFGKLGNKYLTWRVEQFIGPDWWERLGHSTAFLSDNAIGVCFTLHLVASACLLRERPLGAHVQRFWQVAASATFAIYLIHYPALHFFAAASQHALGVVVGPLVGLASLTLAVLACQPGEILKRRLRRWLLGVR
jgi:peptidoglycan/LPS O-acetylase OafA/YrhL